MGREDVGSFNARGGCGCDVGWTGLYTWSDCRYGRRFVLGTPQFPQVPLFQESPAGRSGYNGGRGGQAHKIGIDGGAWSASSRAANVASAHVMTPISSPERIACRQSLGGHCAWEIPRRRRFVAEKRVASDTHPTHISKRTSMTSMTCLETLHHRCSRTSAGTRECGRRALCAALGRTIQARTRSRT